MKICVNNGAMQIKNRFGKPRPVPPLINFDGKITANPLDSLLPLMQDGFWYDINDFLKALAL